MADDNERSDPNASGTGPAHIPGTRRGENRVEGESDEERKDARRSGVADSRPIDDSMPDQA
jgi:hypothetical protein